MTEPTIAVLLGFAVGYLVMAPIGLMLGWLAASWWTRRRRERGGPAD